MKKMTFPPNKDEHVSSLDQRGKRSLIWPNSFEVHSHLAFHIPWVCAHCSLRGRERGGKREMIRRATLVSHYRHSGDLVCLERFRGCHPLVSALSMPDFLQLSVLSFGQPNYKICSLLVKPARLGHSLSDK